MVDGGSLWEGSTERGRRKGGGRWSESEGGRSWERGRSSEGEVEGGRTREVDVDRESGRELDGGKSRREGDRKGRVVGGVRLVELDRGMESKVGG